MSKALAEGSFIPEILECAGGEFMMGLSQMSKPITSDNLGTSKLKIKCTDGIETKHTTINPHGTWQGLTVCPDGQFVCGLRTLVEDFVGDGHDDTGLNNVDICCCTP